MDTQFTVKFEQLARRAMACDACFQGAGLERALISLPQPKWIGPDYLSAKHKVVIVLINPGAGAGWADEENRRFLELLIDFQRGGPIDPLMAHQRNDMPSWGRGRFWSYFFESPAAGGLGLDPQQIALANITWCAAARNLHPRWMLATCFERHTRTLLELLAPDVVLLCGGDTHAFARSMPAKCEIFPLLHYAHREGAAAQLAQLNDPRLREALGIA